MGPFAPTPSPSPLAMGEPRLPTANTAPDSPPLNSVEEGWEVEDGDVRETPMFGDLLDEIDFSTGALGGELISLFILFVQLFIG